MALDVDTCRYHGAPSGSLNTSRPATIPPERSELLLRRGAAFRPPHIRNIDPPYVDITAKAPGYMAVLTFYSFFLRKKSNFKVSKKSHFPFSVPSSLYAYRYEL